MRLLFSLTAAFAFISSITGENKYTSLGCWRDTGDRAIPTLEGKSSLLDGSYGSRVDPIQKCFEAAKNMGYEVFAVQNGGWCASSATARLTYKKHGASTGCRPDGEGASWANAVYEINQSPLKASANKEDKNDRDWIVVQEAKTLEESVSHCQNLGRNMVSILTQEDADHFAAVTADIDTSGSQHGYIRIGLQSPNADCKWSWVDGTQPFNPGNWFWQGGEPNGCRRNELCAQTGRGSKKWNDSKCFYKTYFVCGNGNPEPEKKCDDLEEWCSEMDKEKDCCSETVQTKCPGLCDTCPAVHCEWDEWIVGKCSVECGTGTRTNTRVKRVEESNGGTCTGKPSEVLQCKDKECPIHCEWNDWIIGDCTETCGGGSRTNTRTQKVSAAHGGEECKGATSIDESCNVQECPVDCQWADWKIGDCSETCGDGVRENHRVKLTEALFGGAPCEGKSKATESCNNGICPEQCCTENGVPDNCLGLCVEEQDAEPERRSTFLSICDKFQDIVNRCTIQPKRSLGPPIKPPTRR